MNWIGGQLVGDGDLWAGYKSNSWRRRRAGGASSVMQHLCRHRNSLWTREHPILSFIRCRRVKSACGVQFKPADWDRCLLEKSGKVSQVRDIGTAPLLTWFRRYPVPAHTQIASAEVDDQLRRQENNQNSDI
jgi:hypothetical protein